MPKPCGVKLVIQGMIITITGGGGVGCNHILAIRVVNHVGVRGGSLSKSMFHC